MFIANGFDAGGPSIWTIASAGGPATVLVEQGTDPAWAPEGTRIAFVRVAAGLATTP